MEPLVDPVNGTPPEIHAAEEALRRVRQIEIVLVAVTCLAAVSALFYSVTTSNRTRALADTIADCTTQGGRCYEDNRASALGYRADVLNRLDMLQTRLLEASNCLTLQLLNHRHANEEAHALEAHQHGYLYTPPMGEAPIATPEQLKNACDQFLEAKP